MLAQVNARALCLSQLLMEVSPAKRRLFGIFPWLYGWYFSKSAIASGQAPGSLSGIALSQLSGLLRVGKATLPSWRALLGFAKVKARWSRADRMLWTASPMQRANSPGI